MEAEQGPIKILSSGIVFHPCYICDNSKGKPHPGLELTFGPNSLSPAQAEALYESGFSRYGMLFEFPLTFEDCCPRYRIRNSTFDFKTVAFIKKSISEMEKLAPLAQPLLNSESLKSKPKPADPSAVATSSTSIQIAIEKPELTGEFFELWTKYQSQWQKNSDAFILSKECLLTHFIPSPITDSPYSGRNAIAGLTYGTRFVSFRLNGKLIGVLIADLLPNIWGSIYSLYDPDFVDSKVGTFMYTQGMHLAKLWSMKYFDPGWYVRSSAKMKYKDGFEPCFLLCPDTFTWQPLTSKVKKLLDEKGAVELKETKSEDGPVNRGVENVLFQVDGSWLYITVPIALCFDFNHSSEMAEQSNSDVLIVDLLRKSGLRVLVYR